MKGTACGDEFITFTEICSSTLSLLRAIWSWLFNGIPVLLYLHCSHQTDYLVPDKHEAADKVCHFKTVEHHLNSQIFPSGDTREKIGTKTE